MPLFMIGTQRSGSNLLRLMLNQLPDVAAPHPPHILQRMMPIAHTYGDLSRPLAFSHLVEDVCRLVELNPVPWRGVTLDRANVRARCREHSVMAAFGAVYDVMAESRGAHRWCCKSLANIQYLPEIEAYFDDARYIYLYRDGRDVGVSFRKAVVGEKHYYHIAREWSDTQRLALQFRRQVDPSRFFAISYEEITTDTERTMRRLCEFLGATYHEAMLDFYKSEEARSAAQSSALWGNVVKPVMANNSRKFLREASEEDVRIFELVAGDVLDALGYARVATSADHAARFEADQLAMFDEENRRLKKLVLAQVDADDLKRRDEQAGWIQQIIARNQLSLADGAPA